MNTTTERVSEPKQIGEILGQPESLTCRECGQQFELPFPTKLAALVTKCPDCAEKQGREETAQIIANASVQTAATLADRWARLCPPAFTETQAARLPKPFMLDLVMKWQYGRKGLLLHGETGAGKSRCAWQVLRREFLTGRTVEILDAQSGLKYGAMFGDSAASASEWVNKIGSIGILFLDDVWKARLTDSFEQALFAVINHRCDYLLPIIATTNDTGATLASRMGEDRAAPMIRRLRESCEIISF